ncbi:ACP S-malonyltransferase [Dyadobacter frigoris]|uniref:Malonyl CoA-acyl carrier protein transacylase n=1 Tax=Dyadobacter frigoris TaxID=2576211 RepID=A0A4U6DBG2_9BACT|nr:ACP S-malonyltransferase [Dyadobacter frigoris]TKT93811.1 ACP S-malonyltransferase [Dyadobacter frigoris]GLU50974.1 malonyl CoA-acyl carrier protein transacylase [Dyadobacter frigoris]
MKKAYIFPGQGSQFKGMGLDLYQSSDSAKAFFDQANDILGFDITKIMFEGTDEELKQTNVTQPAIFIHSVVLAKISNDFTPNMVAGHSLGEFSALVAAGALSFDDGLRLVAKRADAMQKACLIRPSTMAAILGLDDKTIEEICAGITDEIVVPANYNCPGQVVISGTIEGVEKACELLKAAGAKRALLLQVGGAFHSPLMEPAREELAAAINDAQFQSPLCPVYQNVNAKPATEISVIKENLIAQLTAPVRWTQSVEQMVADGASLFVECGPGKVLQGLVKKIASGVELKSI